MSLTKAEIEQMPAGTQMTNLIAERVMGWKHYPDDLWERMREWLIQRREFNWREGMPEEYTPRMMISPDGRSGWPSGYSERIDCAWMVIEKLQQMGWSIEISDLDDLEDKVSFETGKLHPGWRFTTTRLNDGFPSRCIEITYEHPSLLVAIGRAALEVSITNID